MVRQIASVVIAASVLLAACAPAATPTPAPTVAPTNTPVLPTLTDILLYHVVEGVALAEDVVTLTSATTLQGDDVTIRVEDGNVFINDAQVIITDIEASNRVIHAIDTVLIP